MGLGDIANVYTVRKTSMVTIPLIGTEGDTRFILKHNQHILTCRFHSQRTRERKHTSMTTLHPDIRIMTNRGRKITTTAAKKNSKTLPNLFLVITKKIKGKSM